ncbi:hypothetical protein PVAG01_03838 [Phlyctema vagabunda]|uniref:Uncharacterized protein n=1 Tax=Phlyctema vagabunda TaxID=108571 RepID=A0ABR4PMK3_9HELO
MAPVDPDDLYNDTELDDDISSFFNSLLPTLSGIPPVDIPAAASLTSFPSSISQTKTYNKVISTVTVVSSVSPGPAQPFQATAAGNPYPTESPDDDETNWEDLNGGKRAGIVIGGIFVIALIIGYCFWKRKCCFKHQGRRTPPGPPDSEQAGPYGSVVRLRGNDNSHGTLNTDVGGTVGLRGGDVALNAVSPTTTSTSPSSPQAPAARTLDPDAPPPSYHAIGHDAIVPPSEHHRIAGQGDAHTEEEFNVVADGKVPLSEIPFEDVDINALQNEPSSSSSSSASRDFHQAHRHGDTTGHTNS